MPWPGILLRPVMCPSQMQYHSFLFYTNIQINDQRFLTSKP